MKNYSLKKQSTFLFIGTFTAYIIHFLSILILVRILPVSDYGVYQKFLLLSNTILALSGFGIVPSLYYFYPTADKKDGSSYILQSSLLIILIGIIINLALLTFKEFILNQLNMVELSPIIIMVGIWVLINHFAALINAIFVLNKHIWYNLWYHPIEKLLQAIFVISFTILGKNYTYAITGLFLYNLIKLLFIFYFILHNYSIANIVHLTKTRFINQIKYSFPLWYGVVIMTITLKIDKFFINSFINADQFAIYSIALSSIPFLTIVYTAFNKVAITRITTYMQSGSFKKAGKLWSDIVIKQLSVTIPAVLFFWVFAAEFIEIVFTKQYLAALPYYRTFIFTLVFIATSYGLVLRGSNNTKKIFHANLVSMLITLTIGILIIPKYLLHGAIITAVIGLITPICFQLSYELKLVKMKFFEWFKLNDIIKILLIAIIAIILVLPFRFWIKNIYILFSLSLIFYSIIVITLQYQFSVFIYSSSIKKNILKVIHTKFSR